MSIIDKLPQKFIEQARKTIIKGPVRLSDVCGFSSQLEARQSHASIPEILFVGSTNVGKSSLLSRLLSPHGCPKPSKQRPRDLPNVSKKLGFTQTLNFYTIGSKVRLVDSPGYGHKSTANHGQIVQDYLENYGKNLRQAYILAHAVKGLGEHDSSVASMFAQMGVPFDVIFTKCDLLSASASPPSIEGLPGIVQQVHQTSSKIDTGLDILRGSIWRCL